MVKKEPGSPLMIERIAQLFSHHQVRDVRELLKTRLSTNPRSQEIERPGHEAITLTEIYDRLSKTDRHTVSCWKKLLMLREMLTPTQILTTEVVEMPRKICEHIRSQNLERREHQTEKFVPSY